VRKHPALDNYVNSVYDRKVCDSSSAPALPPSILKVRLGAGPEVCKRLRPIVDMGLSEVLAFCGLHFQHRRCSLLAFVWMVGTYNVFSEISQGFSRVLRSVKKVHANF